MPFKRGMKRIGGRAKGTPNKLGNELRSKINDFLLHEWKSIQSDFKLLEPKNRLLFYEKLLHYCLPKNNILDLESEEVKAEQPLFETILSYEIDLNTISDIQLKTMIEKSEIFMKSRANNIIKIELPNNERLNID